MSDFVILIDPLGRTGTIEVKYSPVDKKYTVTDITVNQEKTVTIIQKQSCKVKYSAILAFIKLRAWHHFKLAIGDIYDLFCVDIKINKSTEIYLHQTFVPPEESDVGKNNF